MKDELSQIKLEELLAYLEELDDLKSLCFENFGSALLWIKDNADEITGFDEDDGYIDFQFGRFDCAMEVDDDGYWKLTDIVALCDEEGKAIMEVLIDNE